MTAPAPRMTGRRALAVVVPVALATLLATAVPSLAEPGSKAADTEPDRKGKASSSSKTPETAFEMPFPCGEAWTGTTRASHSPSPNAVDWNRTDDDGRPVVAAAPGVVTTANTVDHGSYGKWVVIDHGNNESSLYGHLSQVRVKVGQRVDQGQLIGNVGSTGNSTGPHLHFEERDGSSDMWPWFHGSKFVFGTTQASANCVDVPLAGDIFGGAEAEPVIFTRTSTATFTVKRLKKKPRTFTFGSGTDDPVLGDWDGDGHANLGIRTPATSTFTLRDADGSTSTIVFGRKVDKPIAGDWDGDGSWEVGVFRPRTATFIMRAADGTTSRVSFGTPDDLAVTGDWNGDGETDLGVYDQATATYTLRLVDSDGLEWFATVPFGEIGNLPVVADWDGNGKTDLGAWDPATAVLSERHAKAPTSAKATVSQVKVGHPR